VPTCPSVLPDRPTGCAFCRRVLYLCEERGSADAARAVSVGYTELLVAVGHSGVWSGPGGLVVTGAVWEEPVQGELFPREWLGLSGIEQLCLFLSGHVGRPPIGRLTGMHLTEVGSVARRS
jgi:hypothetical protein